MNRQEPGFSNAWLFAKEHAQPGSQDLDGRACTDQPMLTPQVGRENTMVPWQAVSIGKVRE